jgi:hypothetical protein
VAASTSLMLGALAKARGGEALSVKKLSAASIKYLKSRSMPASIAQSFDPV